MKPKSIEDFYVTLEERAPSKDWSLPLQALWYAAKDNWEASHNIAQDLHTKMGSWIHAYLHRVEGDEWNAGYWYRQAGRPIPESTSADELEELVEFIINE